MKFHRPSPAKASWIAGLVLIVSSLFLARWTGSGLLFLGWTFLCVAAVLGDRLILWVALWATPLALVSFGWLSIRGDASDPFNLSGVFTENFLKISIVVFATGVLSIVRTQRMFTGIDIAKLR